MTTFRYVALEVSGAQRRGRLDADSARAARGLLREQHLTPIEVHAETPAAARTFTWRRHLPGAELALFTRQFSTLVAAGLTIEGALSGLLEETPDGVLRQNLVAIREHVLGGHSLGQAIESSRSFPTYYAAIIRAAEETGALPQVMLRLADYLERGHTLRHKVGLALVYPAIVTVIASLVIGILLTYVVPQIVSVFEHTQQNLPVLTQIMIFLSAFMRKTWWLWLAGGIFAGIAGQRMLRVPSVRLAWHRFLLDLPIIGRLRSGVATARFTNTLAVLIGSGVPVVKAMQHTAAAQEDRVFQTALEQAASRIREGMSLSRALKETTVIPPLVVHLIASGEASGELVRVLEQAARQQEIATEARLSTLTALLEPLLILLMGGVVLLIVLATLEPIIEMNRLMR